MSWWDTSDVKKWTGESQSSSNSAVPETNANVPNPKNQKYVISSDSSFLRHMSSKMIRVNSTGIDITDRVAAKDQGFTIEIPWESTDFFAVMSSPVTCTKWRSLDGPGNNRCSEQPSFWTKSNLFSQSKKISKIGFARWLKERTVGVKTVLPHKTSLKKPKQLWLQDQNVLMELLCMTFELGSVAATMDDGPVINTLLNKDVN